MNDIPAISYPKREAFFYLRRQLNSERYWGNFLRDRREAGAVYAYAIDGLFARGGIVPVDEFAVVSGAPIALKKQVPSLEQAIYARRGAAETGLVHHCDAGGAVSFDALHGSPRRGRQRAVGRFGQASPSGDATSHQL